MFSTLYFISLVCSTTASRLIILSTPEVSITTTAAAAEISKP